MSVSAIYSGTVRHRRRTVSDRDFSYGVNMLYLDLDELPALLGGKLVRRSPGMVRFRRRDFHGDPAVELATAVRRTVRQRSGIDADGPIRLLAQLRSIGVSFNPVSFYYCFDKSGENVKAVLAEVTNTPWNERHAYVIPATPEQRKIEAEFDKEHHVSPFLAMEYGYRARLSVPADALSVQIENWAGDELHFAATLALKRRELTKQSLRRLTLSDPLGPIRVLALIYRQGIGLHRAGVPHQPHPTVR